MVSPGAGACSTKIVQHQLYLKRFKILTGEIYSHQFAVVNRNKLPNLENVGPLSAAATGFAGAYWSLRAILICGMRWSNGIALL
jgi:hypothetical protein